MAIADEPVALPTAPPRSRTVNRAGTRVPLDDFRLRTPDPATTRHQVTRLIVRWYLALLSVVVLAPVYLLLVKGASADDAQKVVVSLSSALTGLAGVLGLAMAFYFKDNQPDGGPRTTPPRRPPRSTARKAE